MKQAILCLIVAALTACGGSSGSSDPAPTQNASPGGIWTGVDTISGLQVMGLVDESGDAHFIRTDGMQYGGTVVTDGAAISANFTAYGQNGGIYGTGTLSGTIVARQSITANTTFQPLGNKAESGTLNLTFNQLYNVASSVATVTGSYGDSYGDTATVYSDGTVFYQSASTGCTGNGVVTVPTPQYNVYQGSITLQSCTGADAILNGAPLSGLATYDNQVAPAQLIVGFTSPGGEAIVLTLTKN